MAPYATTTDTRALVVTFIIFALIYVIGNAWLFLVIPHSDQLPNLVAAHPEIVFQPVSGWYGPGSWLAFVFTATNALWSVIREFAGAQAALPKWNADVVGAAIYSMLVSIDMVKKGREVKGVELEKVLPVLPSLSAALRATSFAAMIMELCFLAHVGRLWELKVEGRPWKPNWPTLVPMLLVWAASVFPLAAISAVLSPLNEIVIAANGTVNPTSPDIQSFIQIEFNNTASYSFAFMVCDELVGSTALFPPRDGQEIWLTFLVGILAAVVGVSVVLVQFESCLVQGIPLILLTLCLSPLGLVVSCLSIIYLFHWPFLCMFFGLSTIFLSIIPQHFAIFPYSGISFSEMDQYGALALVLAMYFLRSGNLIVRRVRGWAAAGGQTADRLYLDVENVELGERPGGQDQRVSQRFLEA